MVPKTEAEKQIIYDVNYTGTIYLCESFEIVVSQKQFANFVPLVAEKGGIYNFY